MGGGLGVHDNSDTSASNSKVTLALLNLDARAILRCCLGERNCISCMYARVYSPQRDFWVCVLEAPQRIAISLTSYSDTFLGVSQFGCVGICRDMSHKARDRVASDQRQNKTKQIMKSNALLLPASHIAIWTRYDTIQMRSTGTRACWRPRMIRMIRTKNCC